MKINEYFSEVSFSNWVESAKSSLNINNKDEFKKFIEEISLEGINLKSQTDQLQVTETQLNTYPQSNLLGKIVRKGQMNDDIEDHGINCVLSEFPIVVSNNQKLIQIITDCKANQFGDEVVVDAFKILEKNDFSIEETLAQINKFSKNSDIKLLINGSLLHDSGADIITEIAHSLFIALKFSESLSVSKTYFLTSVDSQYFSQIAKLRALRYIYETILEKNNQDTSQFKIIARNSLRELTIYDSWNNMLRATSSTMSSFIGGADIIIPQAFDVLNQIYSVEPSSKLSLRQSRNIFHVLKDESKLGFVMDPSKGSHLIEDLTLQMITKSFVKLKDFTSQESIKFLYEKISAQILKTYQLRIKNFHKRSQIKCGINDFSNSQEKVSQYYQLKNLLKDVSSLFPLRRITHELELLRIRFEKVLESHPKKFLIVYPGVYKDKSARISFIQNIFEILGVEVISKSINDFKETDSDNYYATIFCAKDSEYENLFQQVKINSSHSYFIAGNKFKYSNIPNVSMGIDVYEFLLTIVKKEESNVQLN